MTSHFADLAHRVSADGAISPQELLALRQQGWGDGKIHRDEAEVLFAVNNSLHQPDGQWTDFFVEAIGEFVLNGTEPRLMCNDEEAQWLIDQINRDGRLESMAELELLVRVVERAQNVPEALKHYLLKQIEGEVLTGTGPTRHGGDLSDTHISAAECRILRRVIFASGGHGPAAVTRFDAELLFRLKDATLGFDNAPEWADLFVDGVSNFLKGFTLKSAQLSHARVQELEAFIANNRASVGRFMGAMAREAPHVANHFGKVFGKKDERTDYAADQAQGSLVTDDESAWLQSMVDADGELDSLERKLIERLANEG